MESKNLDKAIEIYSKLISGEEICKKHTENGPLYDEFYGNAEVYDIVMNIMKKMNLSLYEYNDSLYITAGEGNRVFGYTNDDMKKLLGLRLNKELYLCYFIMYMTLLYFYKDSSSYQFREYAKSENIIDETSKYLADITKRLDVFSTDEVEQDSFKAIALLWDELPAVTGNQDGDGARASKASRAGYVKLVFNFMSAQRLFVENADRYYPTDRMKALSENYFEEYRGRLYQLLGGEEEDA